MIISNTQNKKPNSKLLPIDIKNSIVPFPNAINKKHKIYKIFF